MFIIFSVFYILVAAAMTVLILIQRGEGANAGASFGGGSSGTVFGARGSASFLSRSTAVLFTVFILLSLGMAIYLARTGAPVKGTDLGVMAGANATAPATRQAAPVAAASSGAATPAPASGGQNGPPAKAAADGKDGKPAGSPPSKAETPPRTDKK